MESRLIIGYIMLVFLIGTVGGAVFVLWRRERADFSKRWGKQKKR